MIRTIFFLSILIFSSVHHSAKAADDLIKREGKHLVLITDLDSSGEIDRIISAFDQSVEQWVEFFGDPLFNSTEFRVQACVMRNESTFRQKNLIPSVVPDFQFGYALNQQVWVKAQASEYYTRHLVLHEGVHAFMFAAFDGAGPTWFQEGTAELLSLHAETDRVVKINQIPVSREQVPYWGRFKRMDQLRLAGEVPRIETVLEYQPNLIGDVGAYSWSWALVGLFQGYPEYLGNLKAAARRGSNRGPKFNREFTRELQDQWPIISARWRLMCHDLNYGFDWERERVELSMNDAAWSGQRIETKVVSDRGWQSIGVRVPGGIKIRVQPEGSVTLAETTRPWISEPAGITLEYHRDRPLGQLLVCVLPNAISNTDSFLEPLEIHSVDQAIDLQVEQYSWLLFRVNDSVGALSDNQGAYNVLITVGS